jgi:hypothetical protein
MLKLHADGSRLSADSLGAHRGNRSGEGLSPAVYFIKRDGKDGENLRIVKEGRTWARNRPVIQTMRFHNSSQTGKGSFEMKTLSTVLFVLLLVSFVQAQRRWTKNYGGSNVEKGYSVQQTSDGGYIVTGFTNSYGAGGNDVYLIKTDASGDTLWTKTYGGTHYDEGYSVRKTEDGGYIIAGATASFADTLNGDVYLIKTNGSGNTDWTRTYGGTGTDVGNSVQQTLDGGYLVAGWTNSFGAGGYDVWLLKTTALGDTQWTRTYGGAADDYGYSVRQTSDGGYIIAGNTDSYGAGLNDVWLIKTTAFGDTQWTRTYGGTDQDYGRSVQQTTDGGYIIAGWTHGAGGTDVYLIKTKANGDTLWTSTCGGDGFDEGLSVQQTSDGGYVTAGLTNSFGNNYDVYLVRMNSSGDTLWTRNYDGMVYDDYGYSVQQTTDGGYIVAGFTLRDFTYYDVWLIKTDENGHIGVEEPGSDRQVAAGSLRAAPNPFSSFARIPGHEAERFNLYDISGKLVGTCSGNRVGEGLAPAVYFVKPGDGQGTSLRIVKVRRR